MRYTGTPVMPNTLNNTTSQDGKRKRGLAIGTYTVYIQYMINM